MVWLNTNHTNTGAGNDYFISIWGAFPKSTLANKVASSAELYC